MYTFDTSALAKAIIPPRRRKKDSIYEEQIRLFKIADSFLTEVKNKKASMNIPSIALIEIAAVGARLTGEYRRGIQASNFLKKHGGIFYDTQFLSKAIDIAAETKISGFDSVFIACAKLTNSTLITDDKRMHEAAISLNIPSKLLRELKL